MKSTIAAMAAEEEAREQLLALQSEIEKAEQKVRDLLGQQLRRLPLRSSLHRARRATRRKNECAGPHDRSARLMAVPKCLREPT